MLTGLLFSRAFCQPSRVTAGTMGPMENTNGTHGEHQLDSGDLYLFPLTVAHWCAIGHCVGVMAAHGVSQGVVFATSHPTHLSPSHPTPLPIPPTPSIINTDSRKRWQKYLEIQPSEIEKASYNKNQWITKYFAAQHASTIQG